jgi:hypothetical protein
MKSCGGLSSAIPGAWVCASKVRNREEKVLRWGRAYLRRDLMAEQLLEDKCCSKTIAVRARGSLLCTSLHGYGQYRLISDNCSCSFTLAALEGLPGSLHRIKFSLINVSLLAHLRSSSNRASRWSSVEEGPQENCRGCLENKRNLVSPAWLICRRREREGKLE